MIVQNSESLHDNPTNPPATTGQPGGLTASTANACATGLPVAGLDLAAADRGANAADLAAKIVPNGSADGRNRLADAIAAERPECKDWSPALRLAVLQRLAIIKNDLYSAMDAASVEGRHNHGTLKQELSRSRWHSASEELADIHRFITRGEHLRGLWWFAWGRGIDFAGGSLGESQSILRDWIKADCPIVINNGKGQGDLCPCCGRKWEESEPGDDGVPSDSPYGGARKHDADGNACRHCGHYENWYRRDPSNTLIDVTA